jgi:DNA-directed RNA polymerase
MCRRNKEREKNMQYAGINWRNEILNLVAEEMIDMETALRECLMYMSMDDNKRVYDGLLEYMGVEPVEEPIVPMYTEAL